MNSGVFLYSEFNARISEIIENCYLNVFAKE